MTTIYNALKNNFSQVSNLVLLDVRLSAKAKALYWYMCYRIGLSEKWEFNHGEILSHFKEGEKAMRPAFKELLEVGFLERRQVRNDGGKFGKHDYTIHAEPVNKPSQPHAYFGRAAKRRAANGRAENASYNNKERNNKDSSNKEISLSAIEEILRENDFENVNAEKIFKWVKNEKKLKYSLENVIISLAQKPENQLKKSKGSSGPSLRYKIQQVVKLEDYEKYFRWAVMKGNEILVTDKRALKYREDLEKINIKIEVIK